MLWGFNGVLVAIDSWHWPLTFDSYEPTRFAGTKIQLSDYSNSVHMFVSGYKSNQDHNRWLTIVVIVAFDILRYGIQVSSISVSVSWILFYYSMSMTVSFD